MQKINELSHAGAFIIGLMAGGAYFYFGVYKDTTIEDQMTQIENQIKESDSQIEAKKKETNKQKEAEGQLENKKMTFSELESYYPRTQTFVSLSAAVSDQLNRFSLREIVKVPVRDSLEKHEFYEILPIQLTVEGKFRNLLDFMSTMANNSNIMTTENLSIVKLPDSEELRVEFVVKGYRFLAEETAVQPGEGTTT